MEMSLYEFILGLVGTFFVLIPALGLLFYTFFKEIKKADKQIKELKLYHDNMLKSLEFIGDTILLLCHELCNSNDKEPKNDEEEE